MKSKSHTKTEPSFQKQKNNDIDHQLSPYIVNNSLPCALMPKRTSINVKAFLQMHRKLLRKKIIQKTFHSSLNQLASQAHQSPKGFRGSARTSYRVSNGKGERAKTVTCQLKQTTFYIESPGYTISQVAGQSRHTFLRPNMNMNLHLFKKSHKKPIPKNQPLDYKMVQTFTASYRNRNYALQRTCKSHTMS